MVNKTAILTNQIEQQIKDLTHQLEVLEQYLSVKIKERDWHACWDVCYDINNVESKIKVLKGVLTNV